MRPLVNQSLIEAWDRGLGQNPLGRALTLLACAWPERTAADCRALAIVERDRELLQLRRAMFGDRLRGFIACSVCGTSLEVEVEISSLLGRMEGAQSMAVHEREIGGCRLFMRQATTADVAAAAAAPDPVVARRVLLERCVTLHPAVALEGELADAAVAMFEELHQDSEIVFHLQCPLCGGTQKSELDIAAYLWTEVSRAGVSLLRDVHELARAYGWTEDSILAMSPGRRACYLEMVRS